MTLYLWPVALILGFAGQTLVAKDGVLIKSSAKSFAVKQDGIRIGGPGQSVSIEPGENSYFITSKGYAPRNIVIWRLDRKISTFTVNFAKAVNRPPLPMLPEAAGPPLLRLSSICQHQRLKTTCNRKTWMDDLIFSGILWLDPKDTTPFQMREELFMTDIPTIRSRKIHPLFFLGYAEALSARYPKSPEAQNYAARESLFKSKCGRIHHLITEAYQVKADSPHLWLSLGLCYEAIGMGQVADSLYKIIPNKLKAPDLSYNHARMLAPKNPIKAVKLAKKCIKQWPGYFPCYEIIEQAKIIQGKKPPNTMEVYRSKNIDHYRGFVAETNRIKKEDPKAMRAYLQEFSREYRTNFEVMAESILAEKRITNRHRYFLKQATFSSPPLVVKQVEELRELDDPNFLGMAFKRATESYPASLNFWGLLINHHYKKGSCNLVVTTIRNARRQLKSMPNSLGQKEGACLLKSKRFDEAITVYKALLGKNKKSWRSHHNLGVAYDAAGSTKLAVKQFKKALALGPPEVDAEKILDRIIFKKHKYKKRPKKHKPKDKASVQY